MLSVSAHITYHVSCIQYIYQNKDRIKEYKDKYKDKYIDK
jgi:hypothetical protein